MTGKGRLRVSFVRSKGKVLDASVRCAISDCWPLAGTLVDAKHQKRKED